MGIQNPKTISLELNKDPITNILSSDFNPALYHTLTGTFGTKTQHDPYHENLESRSIGTITSSLGRLAMRINGGSSVSNSLAYSGTKSWRHDMDANEFPEVYYIYNTPTPHAYHSCRFYYSGALTGTNASWKFGRFGNGNVYEPNRYAHMYVSSGGSVPTASAADLTVDVNQITEYAATNDVTDRPQDFTQNAWHLYEIECSAGTVNGGDASFHAYIDGKKVVQFTGSSLRTTANPDLIKWSLSFLTGLANATTNTMIFNIDEFYFDASRARVVMTDTQTYTGFTKWAIQPLGKQIGAWSPSQIFCQKNGAGFAIGDTGYLHVFNDAGVYLGMNSTVTVDANYMGAV